MEWNWLPGFGLVALAGGLGGVIGLEREVAGKPAGMRTHILVASASALLILLSRTSFELFSTEVGPDRLEADPIRIIQAVIIGISFLGGGTIIRDRSKTEIEGLTTAGSIFLTAALGIGVGLGQIWLSTAVTAFALFVLLAVPHLERLLQWLFSKG